MSVSRECCVLSGTGLCNGPITRPKESTQCVESKCEGGTSTMRSWTITAVAPVKYRTLVNEKRCRGSLRSRILRTSL